MNNARPIVFALRGSRVHGVVMSKVLYRIAIVSVEKSGYICIVGSRRGAHHSDLMMY
jgi:hypothetical protein